MVEEYRGRAREKGLSLTCATAPDLAPLRTDAPLLRVVLGNLVANAIKFTTTGEVEVEVARRGPATVFAIRDTGPGIPPAARSQIFDPFTQLEEARRKHIPGVGLGLPLVRDIVAALGGSVELSSEVETGSTFRVVLPDQADPE